MNTKEIKPRTKLVRGQELMFEQFDTFGSFMTLVTVVKVYKGSNVLVRMPDGYQRQADRRYLFTLKPIEDDSTTIE